MVTPSLFKNRISLEAICPFVVLGLVVFGLTWVGVITKGAALMELAKAFLLVISALGVLTVPSILLNLAGEKMELRAQASPPGNAKEKIAALLQGMSLPPVWLLCLISLGSLVALCLRPEYWIFSVSLFFGAFPFTLLLVSCGCACCYKDIRRRREKREHPPNV